MVPEDRNVTDPTVLERSGWICEADLEHEKEVREKAQRGKKTKKAAPVRQEDEFIKYYCQCRQVCFMFMYIFDIWRCPQMLKMI
jgi:hypothetical protein